MVELPRRAVETGTEVTLLVLSTSALGLLAIDLASGALVRSAWGCGDLDTFSVIRAWLGDGDGEPEHAQPEAVTIDAYLPEGHMPSRRAERWVRPLLHPDRTQVLGFAGPAIPMWRLQGDRPTAAIVSARADIGRGDDGNPRARFRWMGLWHDLPVASRFAGRLPALANRIVVALTEPIDGHCYKVVTGLLP